MLSSQVAHSKAACNDIGSVTTDCSVCVIDVIYQSLKNYPLLACKNWTITCNPCYFLATTNENYFIVAAGSVVFQISLNGTDIDVLINGTSNAIAIDYDYRCVCVWG